PVHLTAHDLDLMPKNEQFDVAFVLQALACPDQPTQEEVEERKQHGSPSQLRGERMLTARVGSRTGISEPFTSSLRRKTTCTTRRWPAEATDSHSTGGPGSVPRS